MANKWPTTTISDISENLDSKRVPVSKLERKPGNIPYYGATGIVDFVDDYIFDEELLLIGEDGADWSGGANTAFIINGKSWVNNHAHVLKIKDANIQFVMNYLNYSDLRNYISGTTRGKLNQASLNKIIVPNPPIKTQQRIADILSIVDDAIEKTDQIIQKTEKLKQGFLDKLLNSKSKDWKRFTLDELCNFTTGRLNSNQAVDGGIYPFFTCAKETFSINRHSFDTKAVLLAGNNAAGIYSVKFYHGKFDAYQRTYVITVKDEFVLNYHFLKELLNIRLNLLKDYSVGTNTKFLTIKLLLGLEVFLPPIDIQKQIVEVLSTLDKKINAENTKKEKLKLLKSGLMSDIFSRKVEVN